MRAPRAGRGASARVFVYGTLLRGESNHRLLAKARFVGEGRTRPEFRLHHLGGFPALVAGGVHAVEGEVYEVDEATLAALDALEGHPRFYRRVPISMEDGASVEAYLLRAEQVEGRPVIDSGSWRLRPRE
jgi:gamma-glutamylaminecyclotransferase